MPFSLNENELRENLLVGTWELDEADMALIKTVDRRHHYLDPYNWYGLPLWD
jgi:diketogulonate reductase-like aldo/keto reductase